MDHEELPGPPCTNEMKKWAASVADDAVRRTFSDLFFYVSTERVDGKATFTVNANVELDGDVVGATSGLTSVLYEAVERAADNDELQQALIDQLESALGYLRKRTHRS